MNNGERRGHADKRYVKTLALLAGRFTGGVAGGLKHLNKYTFGTLFVGGLNIGRFNAA